jgi:hypothetical protein
VRAAHLVGIEVADSHRADFSSLDECGHRIHFSFRCGKAKGLVDLIQPDAVSREEAQPVINGFGDVTCGTEQGPPFCSNDHLLVFDPRGFQRRGKGPLRHSRAIEFGRVEPVDATIQPGFDGGVFLLLVNDGKRRTHHPATTREFHHPQSNGCDGNTGFTKRSFFNFYICYHPLCLSSSDYSAGSYCLDTHMFFRWSDIDGTFAR